MSTTSKNRHHYVVGFLMDTQGRVVLVQKNRPRWQEGLLNGVGGRIEPGETPIDAMRREFLEEAGITVNRWEQFMTLHFDGGAVECFRAVTGPRQLDKVRTCTDEPVSVYDTKTVTGPSVGVVPNLRWLLPLAAHMPSQPTPLQIHA